MAEQTVAQTAAPAVETAQETKKAVAQKLIEAQHKFGRGKVYVKGVAAEDNVGRGC